MSDLLKPRNTYAKYHTHDGVATALGPRKGSRRKRLKGHPSLLPWRGDIIQGRNGQIFNGFISHGDAYKMNPLTFFNKHGHGPGESFWASHNSRFWTARKMPYWLYPRDVFESQKYWDEVKRLDATDAGKKARELLMSFLNERQRDEFERYGYFTLTMWWKDKDRPLIPAQNTVLHWKFQAWPNVEMVLLGKDGKKAPGGGMHLCIHPEEPYPSGDLLLTQYLEITQRRGLTYIMDNANY